MSYFPITPDQVAGQGTFAAYAARLNLVRAHVVGTTSATFVNPNIGESVTISVTSSTGVQVGDHIVIGERWLQCTTPATVTASPVTLTSLRTGSEVAGTVIPSGTFLVTSATGTSSRLVTTTTTSPGVPDATTGASVSVGVASFANVVANTTGALTTHAGTFVVTAVAPGSITVFKLARGDVPSTTTMPSGISFATGVLLGVVNYTSPNISWDRGQWGLVDCYISRISATGAGATTVSVGVGWSPADSTGRDAFADMQSFTLPGPATFTAGTYRSKMTMPTQNVKRLACPAGHAVMARVLVAGNSTTDVASIFAAGLYGG